MVGIVAGRHGYSVQVRREGVVGGLRRVVQRFMLQSRWRVSPLPQWRGGGSSVVSNCWHTGSGWVVSRPQLEIGRELRGSHGKKS